VVNTVTAKFTTISEEKSGVGKVENLRWPVLLEFGRKRLQIQRNRETFRQ